MDLELTKEQVEKNLLAFYSTYWERKASHDWQTLHGRLEQSEAGAAAMREAINTVVSMGCSPGAFRRHCIPTLSKNVGQEFLDRLKQVEADRDSLRQQVQALREAMPKAGLLRRAGDDIHYTSHTRSAPEARTLAMQLVADLDAAATRIEAVMKGGDVE